MKTFFIALILGIFIGAMITAYHNSPESFESLIPSSLKREADQEPNPDPDSKPEEPKPADKIVEQAKEAASKAIEKSGEIAQDIKEGAKDLMEKTDGGATIVEKGKDIVDSAKDAGIKATISGKLKLEESVDSSRIQVEVANGSVTLTGTVSSAAEERKVRDLALDTRFVKDVKSELTIKQ